MIFGWICLQIWNLCCWATVYKWLYLKAPNAAPTTDQTEIYCLDHTKENYYHSTLWFKTCYGKFRPRHKKICCLTNILSKQDINDEATFSFCCSKRFCKVYDKMFHWCQCFLYQSCVVHWGTMKNRIECSCTNFWFI